MVSLLHLATFNPNSNPLVSRNETVYLHEISLDNSMMDNYHTKEVASSESCRGNLNPPKDVKTMKCRISQTSKAFTQLFSPRDPWSFLFVCLESPGGHTSMKHNREKPGTWVPGSIELQHFFEAAKCMNTSNVPVNEIHVYTCRKHVSINFIIHSA